MASRRIDVSSLALSALVVPLLAASALAHSPGASGPVQDSPRIGVGAGRAVRSTFRTTGGVATIVEEEGPLAATPTILGLNTSRGLWSYGDNGQGWVGRAVAIGDAGTQVFTEFDTAADRASLISGFDVDPVLPVWADPVVDASLNARVHGCDATGLFVSCRQVPVTQNGPRHVVVSAYGSSSANPLWTWTFPTVTSGGSRAMVTRDGGRIVAGMLDPTTSLLHVAVFDNGSPVPTAYFTRAVGLQLQAFVLAEDGHTLYAASTTGGYLIDVDSHALIQQIVLLQSFAGQDISGDGSVLAIGYFNGVDLWERQAAGNFLRTWQGTWPGSIVCQQLDLSEDGSTLVLGFGYFDQNLRIRVEAIDVSTRNTTMVDEAQGAGSYQNIVSKVACSADGQTFAVGLWGDEAGLVPELRVYRRNQNAPVALYDYPGSVYDVAISADGKRIAVGTKAVHANLLAGGGTVDLYANGDEDFAAVGTPSIGRKVDFEMWGAPNSPARLLLAPHAATNPFPVGALGVLYLERDELSVLPMPDTGPHGFSTGEFQVPLDPALIGTTLWFQGMTTIPRRFTGDFVRLTILP
jgi:hypothetical protein